jgi:Na+-driven multidrug efflux pump
MIALYTGVARSSFIIIDTLILAVVNIILNYGFVFGNLGLPEMGIGGAALASSISEVVAFVIFVVYILFDKKAHEYSLFKLPNIDMALIRQQYSLAFPIVVQAFVGLGSWFFFFGIVENLGPRDLAITNLVRMVYLILSIPCWGFASGVNTMVSNLIGQQKRQAVVPIIRKTALLCWLVTMALSLPIVIFPQQMLYPLLGSQDMSLITDAQPIFYLLLVILTTFSFGGVLFNGLAGTGATYYGLKIQTVCAIGYLAYIYIEVNFTSGGLFWAWAAEIFYWFVMIILTLNYLNKKQWHLLKV